MATRRAFGTLRRLPSRRWQATYVGPDLARHCAPSTFTARIDAEAYLAAEQRLVERGQWTPPAQRSAARKARPLTLAEYAGPWLEARDVRPRTRTLYASLLRLHVLPALGDVPLAQLSGAAVRAWHARLRTGATTRAHAYGLLRVLMATAVQDGLATVNPCAIKGAGQTRRAHVIEPASPAQLAVLIGHMPPQWRSLVMVSAWGGLRIGEALALRREDVDLARGAVKVRRQVQRVKGAWLVGPPKTAAGVRDVHLPGPVVDELSGHLDARVPPRGDALLWSSPTMPGTPLMHSTLRLAFKPAAAAAGLPGMRWHDLRHTGAVLAAQAGGTTANLMARLGHSTPAAAMRYQHSAAGRDAMLAERMSF